MSSERMRMLGLLGGMSWESTATYYRLLNEGAKARLGGLHSAPLLLHSVDFDVVARLQRAGDWDAAGDLLAGAARGLVAAGAEALLICANTMHRVAPAIATACGVPLVHLVDATAAAIRGAGLSRVGLLGTRFTMEQAFYRDRLAAHGLDVRVPAAADRDALHRIVYEELCLGRIEAASRERVVRVMDALAAGGAEGIVLGCTEIPLLVGPGDTPLPLFDTTALHAAAALDWALGGGLPEAPATVG